MLEIIYHSFGFIIIISVLIIAYKFLNNYRISKQKELVAALLMILSFLSGLLFYSPFFIISIVYNQELTISTEVYLFFNFGFIPVVIISWFYCFMRILYPNSMKLKVAFYFLIIISIIYEIFYILFLFFDNAFGITINSQDHPYITIYRIPSLLIGVILASVLAYKSITSKDIILRFRGIFLVISFIFIGIGMSFDTGIFVNTIEQIIGRIFIIIGFIFIYYGFFITEEKRMFKFLYRIFSVSSE